jgi:hypothetical protein
MVGDSSEGGSPRLEEPGDVMPYTMMRIAG